MWFSKKLQPRTTHSISSNFVGSAPNFSYFWLLKIFSNTVYSLDNDAKIRLELSTPSLKSLTLATKHTLWHRHQLHSILRFDQHRGFEFARQWNLTGVGKKRKKNLTKISENFLENGRWPALIWLLWFFHFGFFLSRRRFKGQIGAGYEILVSKVFDLSDHCYLTPLPNTYK